MLPDLLQKIEKALKVILTVPCACGKDKALMLWKAGEGSIPPFVSKKRLIFLRRYDCHNYPLTLSCLAPAQMFRPLYVCIVQSQVI